MATKPTEALKRLRDICVALPEVSERPSHGAPTFFIRDKTSFVMAWLSGHHDDGFPHLWCAAPLGMQEAFIARDPTRFFRPPYVGHRGWIAVRLDGKVDWDEVAEICRSAYRAVAPKRLASMLDASDQ
ncbi:MAG: MmcQ/YjbR family DNA-binding protein [Acidimicrobiales bacterium]